MNRDELRSVLVPYSQLEAAFAKESNEENLKEIHVETFDLDDTATLVAPRVVEFAFRSFMVIEATDDVASVRFFPNNRHTLPPNTAGVPANKNFVFRSGVPIQRAEFYWTVQAGKSVTIVFFRRSEVSAGNQNQTISELFSSTETKNAVAASSTRATLIAANTSRKAFTVYNFGPNTAYVGDVNVVGVVGGAGTKVGLPIAMGGSAQFKNSAIHYVICDAAETAVLAVNEES